MRIILITGLLLLLSLTAALAGDSSCTGCNPGVAGVADSCGKLFTVACVRVLYTPRCDWPEHRCAVPFIPCDRAGCTDPPCHEPLTPCEPCGWVLCLDPPCHQPVVSADPCDPCSVDPALTGSREFITEACTCRTCGDTE